MQRSRSSSVNLTLAFGASQEARSFDLPTSLISWQVLEKSVHFWAATETTPETGVVTAAAATIAGMEAEAKKPTTVEMSIFSKLRFEMVERMCSVLECVGCSSS